MNITNTLLYTQRKLVNPYVPFIRAVTNDPFFADNKDSQTHNLDYSTIDRFKAKVTAL